MPLFIAPIDVELKVAKILVDEKTKKHLLNLGVNVGSTIKVISNSQRDVIVKILETTLALNKETAMKIIVAA
ncbi:putative ferrous iron transport protein A [Coprobacillus sp. CAG:698]|nr:putative ferrous iron transport protein A [Coprobacillus sp. CAG:698]